MAPAASDTSPSLSSVPQTPTAAAALPGGHVDPMVASGEAQLGSASNEPLLGIAPPPAIFEVPPPPTAVFEVPASPEAPLDATSPSAIAEPNSGVSSADIQTLKVGGLEGQSIPVSAGAIPTALEGSSAQPAFVPPIPSRSSGKRRVFLFGMVGAIVVLVLSAVFMLSSSPTRSLAQASASAVNLEQHPVPPVAVPPAAAIAVAAPVSATPEAPADSTASAPQLSAAVPAVVAEDDVEIAVNIKPDGSLFSYKGKVLGRTPFMLKHPRGEKRIYEVRKVGHRARRVVLTGKETSIGFALEQEVPHPDFL